MARHSPQRSMSGFIGATGGLPAAPANTAVPTITGTATNGSTLTAGNGTWTGREAPSFSYQWKRNGAAVAGRTAQTYLLGAADVGTTITVTVTGTNWAGSASATSAATAAVT